MNERWLSLKPNPTNAPPGYHISSDGNIPTNYEEKANANLRGVMVVLGLREA